MAPNFSLHIFMVLYNTESFHVSTNDWLETGLQHHKTVEKS
jgi:hypothetical protein